MKSLPSELLHSPRRGGGGCGSSPTAARPTLGRGVLGGGGGNGSGGGGGGGGIPNLTKREFAMILFCIFYLVASTSRMNYEAGERIMSSVSTARTTTLVMGAARGCGHLGLSADGRGGGGGHLRGERGEGGGVTTTTNHNSSTTSQSQNQHDHHHHLTPTGHSNTIYGLVHMAKTAGTEINGELALNYERVCGNKGHSYNFAKINQINLEKGAGRCCRGAINTDNIVEIGLDNCDYIAIEDHYTKWTTKIAQHLMNNNNNNNNQNSQNDTNTNIKMELHVPCRESINQLMSLANYQGRLKLDCDGIQQSDYNTTYIDTEVSKIVNWDTRFHHSLLEEQKLNYNTNFTFTVKCFNPIPVSTYVQYMSTRLQKKRTQHVYVHRDSNNRIRKKDEECIWNDTKLQQLVKESMIRQYPYYKFCDECMGTTNELQLS